MHNSGRSYELHEKLTLKTERSCLFRGHCIETEELVAVRLLRAPISTLYHIRSLYSKISSLPSSNILPLVDSFLTLFPQALSKELVEERSGWSQAPGPDAGGYKKFATVAPLNDWNAHCRDTQSCEICLVFPFCSNGNLCDLGRNTSNPPPHDTRTVHILTQVANGLRCLHDVRLIHGNLGPRSVLRDLHDKYWLTDVDKQFYETPVSCAKRALFLEELERIGGSFDNLTGALECAFDIEESAPPEWVNDRFPTKYMDVWQLGSLGYFLSTGHSWLHGNSWGKSIQILRDCSSPRLFGDCFSIEMKSFILLCCGDDPYSRPGIHEVLKHGLLSSSTGPFRTKVTKRGLLPLSTSETKKRSSSYPAQDYPRTNGIERSKSAVSRPQCITCNPQKINHDLFSSVKKNTKPITIPFLDDENSLETPSSNISDQQKPFTSIMRRVLYPYESEGNNYRWNDPHPYFKSELLIGIAEEIDKAHPRFVDDLREVISKLLREQHNRR